MISHFLLGCVVPLTYFGSYYIKKKQWERGNKKFDSIEMTNKYGKNLINKIEAMTPKQIEWFDKKYSRIIMRMNLEGRFQFKSTHMKETIAAREPHFRESGTTSALFTVNNSESDVFTKTQTTPDLRNHGSSGKHTSISIGRQNSAPQIRTPDFKARENQ